MIMCTKLIVKVITGFQWKVSWSCYWILKKMSIQLKVMEDYFLVLVIK